MLLGLLGMLSTRLHLMNKEAMASKDRFKLFVCHEWSSLKAIMFSGSLSACSAEAMRLKPCGSCKAKVRGCSQKIFTIKNDRS